MADKTLQSDSISLAISTFFNLLILLIRIFDLVTYPIWYLVQRPWRRVGRIKGMHSKSEAPLDGELVFHSIVEPGPINEEVRRYNLNTLEKVFSHAVGKYNDKLVFGTRERLSETIEAEVEGKVLVKYELGDYSWRSYTEFGAEASNFGKGLRQMGLQPRQRIAIMSETRVEWMIAAYGCFQHSLVLVTLYTNLGDDGLVHALEETEVDTIICSYETHAKIFQVINGNREQLSKLKNIIMFEDSLCKKVSETNIPQHIKCSMYKDVLTLGTESSKMICEESATPPSPDCLAIVMYTSGSTGKPKGVMLSHRNLVHAMEGLSNVLDYRSDSDRYVAYLPLAHVMELLAETCCMAYGIKIGYSSPHTLTSKSLKVKSGEQGDVCVLKPTIICCVPLVLERIYKTITETMKSKGWFVEDLFNYLVQYKLMWQAKGFDTTLLDRTLFKKIRNTLGGDVRFILSGGAPLSTDTQMVCSACLCAPIVQGYGLTETASCASVSSFWELTPSRGGVPLYNTDIKLVNWEEGNYRVTDKPNPRGEVHVGGDNIAVGYFNNEEETKLNYYEENDRRWFRTGDIGEYGNDGSLKIIDRKKDLVKLQAGEYISYGRCESILKTTPIVENICMYADPTKNHTIAIVIPDKKRLITLKTDINQNFEKDLKKLVDDPLIETLIVSQLKEHGVMNGLKSFEIPKRVVVVLDEWTPESGLVTAALKLRRKYIYDVYQDKIKNIYS